MLHTALYPSELNEHRVVSRGVLLVELVDSVCKTRDLGDEAVDHPTADEKENAEKSLGHDEPEIGVGVRRLGCEDRRGQVGEIEN